MITMTKTKLSKIKHQVKSNMYYVFWGACTVAVMAGQIYVGTGYRKMSNSLDTLVDSYVNRPRTMPADKDRQTSQSPYQMPIIR